MGVVVTSTNSATPASVFSVTAELSEADLIYFAGWTDS